MGDLDERFLSARRQIERLFITQCVHGAQVQGFPAKAAACGQFIGEDAKTLVQRGIHGTAAALRVLAGSEAGEASALVPKLFHYLDNRIEIEKRSKRDRESDEEVDQRCARDAANVIKVAEILDALSFLKPTLQGREAMIKRLVDKLKGGIRHDKGWDFFLDNPGNTTDVLPTAYAVLALGRHGLGGEIRGPVRYLAEQLKLDQRGGDRIKRTSDITARVMALYALTFGKIKADELPPGEARRAFRRLWTGLERLLADDFEQNVEYWRESRTYYVRVPWSLYLLALAARLDSWKFGSNAAQSRLASILDDANGQGFRYHYSGRMLSSRTSAILYDILGNVARDANAWLINPIRLVDGARSFVSSFWFRGPIGVMAGGYATYSITQWSHQGRPSDLAPNFVASALTSIFMLMVKSR